MNVLFIGCGKMGSIIANNLILEKSIKAKKLSVIEKSDQNKISGANYFKNSKELADKKYKADICFIAIKPQGSEKILTEIKNSGIFHENTIFISILAGKKLEFLESIFGTKAKIIRSMPNITIQDSQGIFIYQENKNLNVKESKKLYDIFSRFGLAYKINDEKLFDPLTSLYGSGPGFLFLLQEIFSKIANKYKIPKSDQDLLTKQLFLGSALTSYNSKLSFKDLKKSVTSKNGVTAAGLDVLEEQKALEKIFNETINESNKRSKELSSK